MAIVKLTKTAASRSLAAYLLGPTDHAGVKRSCVEVLCSTISRTVEDITQHLELTKRRRPTVRKTIVHLSISLAPADHEPTREIWQKIALQMVQGMGYQCWVAITHGRHIHIAASRVRFDGSLVPDAFDYRRSEVLMRQIEVRFGLVRTKPSHLLSPRSATRHTRSPKSDEIALAARGALSAKVYLQTVLADLTRAAITASDFAMALHDLGIDLRTRFKGPLIAGFSFGVQGHVFKASSLGKSFKYRHLQERGFTYVKDRDYQNLSAANLRSRASTAQRLIDGRQETADRTVEDRVPSRAGKCDAAGAADNRETHHKDPEDPPWKTAKNDTGQPKAPSSGQSVSDLGTGVSGSDRSNRPPRRGLSPDIEAQLA